MNFIDKDAVVATIKKHVQEERHSYFCKCLLSEIDALEVKEQPSLPDNLDEAAEEYARLDDEGVWKDGGKYKGFKAGAEWMAGQGYTVDGIVICDKELTRGYKDIVMRIPDELKVDDKVTIQIRKREE